MFCKVDVISEEDVDAAFSKSRAAGQERILTSCAGTGIAFKTASRAKQIGEVKHFLMADFEKIIQINLMCSFRCAAKSAAGMLSLEPLQDGERDVIINTSSVAAQDGQIGQIRDDLHRFALESHRRAIAATEAGR